MVGDDLIRELSLFEQGRDDGSHRFCLLYRQVHPLPGINKQGEVVPVGVFRDVLVFVKPALVPVGTAVAGAGRAITAGTAEGTVAGAVRNAQASKDTFTVVIALKGHLAFMGQPTMKLDFFTDCRLVLADRLCNGGFGRAVGDAGEDDASFLQG